MEKSKYVALQHKNKNFGDMTVEIELDDYL